MVVGQFQLEGNFVFVLFSGVVNVFGDVLVVGLDGFINCNLQIDLVVNGVFVVFLLEVLGLMVLCSVVVVGNLVVEFFVGVKYIEGDGIVVDLIQVVVWYQKVVDKGFVLVQYCFVSFYEKGWGVDKDLVKVKVWYM